MVSQSPLHQETNETFFRAGSFVSVFVWLVLVSLSQALFSNGCWGVRPALEVSMGMQEKAHLE